VDGGDHRRLAIPPLDLTSPVPDGAVSPMLFIGPKHTRVTDVTDVRIKHVRARVRARDGDLPTKRHLRHSRSLQWAGDGSSRIRRSPQSLVRRSVCDGRILCFRAHRRSAFAFPRSRRPARRMSATKDTGGSMAPTRRPCAHIFHRSRRRARLRPPDMRPWCQGPPAAAVGLLLPISARLRLSRRECPGHSALSFSASSASRSSGAMVTAKGIR
jgi:hypothetical protein